MSRRLEVLLDHVQAEVIADIGCDHAILAVEAVRRGKAKKAYACDIAEGPLSRARETIETSGMAGSVIPVLSDGLAQLPEACGQIIIAGMGAETIIHILEQGRGKVLPDTRLLLSPHTRAPQLRSWLAENGFEIVREQFIEDRDRFYPLMEVCCARKAGSYGTEDLELGVNPLPDGAYRRFLHHEMDRLQRLLNSLPADRKTEAQDRLARMAVRLEQLLSEQECGSES